MPFIPYQRTGWGGTMRTRRRPAFAEGYVFEIRFPGKRADLCEEDVRAIQSKVQCMVKRQRLIPRFNLDSFTVYVKTTDELIDVCMASVTNDVAVYRLHTPVPRQARAAASAP